MNRNSEKYRLLIENMPDAFAYHSIVTDNKGKPVEYIFLEVNPAFEKMTGLKREEIIGKKVTAVLPGIKKSYFDWIGTYGKVASNGEPVRFERYSESLGRWYEICTYSEEPGYFATVFHDITDAKKIEQQLIESEMKYLSMFEQSTLGIYLHDLEGNLVDVNQEASIQLGYKKEELLEMSVFDLHPQDESTINMPKEEIIKAWSKWQPGDRYVQEAQQQRKDGSVITVQVTTGIVKYGDKKKLLAMVQDISDRKQAEEKLEQEKNEKELILSNLTEQVSFLDPEMRIIWANSKVIERHNLENVYYKGEKCYEVYHQLKKPCPDCPIIDVFKTGTASDGVHRAPDGRYWNVAGKPVFDEDDKMIGVLNTALDISDLIVAQQDLQEREDRFQRMLRVIPDMISVHDTDMNIVYSNWTGFAAVPPEKQVLNTKCYKTYRDYDQVCPDCRAIQVFDSKETFQQEVELAENYWIDLRVIPILDSSGEVEYFIEWVRDISSLKAIEEELKILNVNLELKVEERTAQLKVANRELDAFTHSASHDLRSPLNRISGFSQAILEDCSDQLDSQSRDYLQRINRSCEHMKLLIDDLLKLSQVSQMQISCEPVEISALVNVCLKELKAREPDRQVETVIAPGLITEGDTALLRIALENLLGNAWKYTVNEDVARIEFGSILQEGKEIFYIRDNGTGFDMKHADKLFTPFQRLHNAKSYPGTGIGLSIVSRIIHRHGGEIWAEGEEGKGSCFYFTLP